MNVVISARGVVKRYGRTVALAGLVADIGPGVTGLLGPNGAGKTTFFSLVLGLRSRDGGELTVLGKDPATAGIANHSRVPPCGMSELPASSSGRIFGCVRRVAMRTS